jgi:prophage regulatory protein
MNALKEPYSAATRLMNVGEVAKQLKVSGRTVYRLADAGLMPRPVRLGGAVRWDRVEIDRWIDSGCPAVTPRKGGQR